MVCLCILLATIAPRKALAAPPAYHPSQLRHLGDARQVVVVTSKSWHSSYATMRAYRQDSDGRWHLRFGPWRARLGYAGTVRAADRRQNTGTTPAGTFRLLSGFGSRRDPGTRLSSYIQFDNNDWWPIDPRDPATYNVYQHSRSDEARWRRTEAERLANWGTGQYRYGVVIDYNLPTGVRWSSAKGEYVAGEPADTRKGGAIFLHVNGRGATAGCVSVNLLRMRRVLRWLDTAKQPRIVIGPLKAIDEL
jgi:L,D-peptidoglycan transpeptidase YkuD (ErfK/YbiS/YcfS/YnhG family)